MKRKFLVSGLILTLAVIGAGGYWIFFAKKGATTVRREPHPPIADVHDHTEGNEFYTCPMHPTVIQDKPGDCPICGMKLEKRTHSAAAAVQVPEEVGAVQLSPAMVQTLGVRSEEIKSQRLIKEIQTAGQIDYNEQAIKVISARVPGRIDKLFVDFTGVTVKQGDPLVLLYSPELISAQQEYLSTVAVLEKIHDTPIHEVHEHAKTLVDASRQRLRLWGITDQQIQALEEKNAHKLSEAKSPLPPFEKGGKGGFQGGLDYHLTIYAPVSGTVTQKNVVEGMYVSEGTPLYTIVDLSTVWMYADVYEYELSLVKVGQLVEIRLPAYPGQKFQGTITFIDPILNPNTRTVRVRAEIKNQESLLKPGMFANAFLQTVVGENVVAVPESAVIYSGERNMVLLDRGNGKFTPREVTLGTLAKGYYQVLSGVSPGEWVVTSANFLIDSESNLRTAVAKMVEESH